jgi:6-pyruvoyltetrahydropterin/6-carboxytetrahydropterin synthase
MYHLTKTLTVAGAHHLALDYDSKCTNLHGHNWRITVHCQGEKLNANGMLVDFADIKKAVEVIDHGDLNRILYPLNPTAENLAKWLCDRIPQCCKVEVQETEGNVASYER